MTEHNRGDISRVRVRFVRRPATAAFVLAMAVVTAIGVWAGLTQPAPDPAIAIVLVVVGWASLALVLLRPPTELVGSTVIVRALLWNRRVDLAEASDVAVRGYRNGSTYLLIAPARGRAVRLPLLVWNDIAPHHGRGAAELTDIARVLEQVGRGPSCAAAIRSIRQQAEHLTGGGSLQDSPLRQD